MPNPSGALASLRPDLGTLYEFDLAHNRSGMVAYRVLPVLQVAKSSGTFGRIPTEQLGKIASVVRGSSGGYNRTNFTFDDDTYATKEYGLEGVVDRRNANLYSDYFDAQVATTGLVIHNVLAAAEVRVAAAIFNTTTFTGAPLTTAVGTEWDTIASAVPITNVMAASQKVRDNCGMYANAAIMSRKVFRNAIQCAQVIDRIAAAGAGDKVKPSDITPMMLAQCFDLEEIIIADCSKDSANEGAATTFADIWDDEYCMVCRIGRTSSIAEPCIGRTFHWPGDGSELDGAIESYESNDVRGDVIRVRHDVHEKVIYAECGHLLSNITT